MKLETATSLAAENRSYSRATLSLSRSLSLGLTAAVVTGSYLGVASAGALCLS